MNSNHPTEKHANTQRKFSDFQPLIIIIAGILLGTFLLQIVRGFSIRGFMLDFMGLFFVVFSGFKLLNLSGFVTSFQMYDLIAKQSKAYATAYPFIELGLGILFLSQFLVYPALLITLFLMTIGIISIILALRQKQEFQCACLGTVINLPLTYVSLIEDIVMAIMALIMLLI